MAEAPKKKKSLIRRILKWTGITFLLLLIFIIIAPFIFKDKIVQFIKDEANASLNAKVDFGTFDLTLISSFPQFTLSINDVSVANVEPFKGDTLFSTKNLTATIDLMSVISGDQYKIRTIILDHPRIYAKVLQNGKASWDITKADTSKKTATTSSEPTKFKMSLKKLEIKDGRIIYDDASMGFFTSLVGFDHTLGGDFTQDDFTLETVTGIKEFTMAYGGIKYMNKVKTEIKANLEMDMVHSKYTFKENTISLNELGFGIDGFVAMPNDKDITMDLKFKANQSEFKNFLSLIPSCYTKDFASVKTAGKLTMDGFVKGTYNDKVMPAFGAHVKIDDAMFQYPSLPSAVKDIAVDVNVDNPTGDPDKTVIDIKKFHVEMAGNPVDMKMHVETPVSDPNINGSIMGRINLATVKDFVPLGSDQTLNGNVTADVKLAGHVSSLTNGQYDKFKAEGKVIVMDMNYKSKDMPYDVLLKSMTLNFSPQFVELAGFDAKIGKSDIAADGKIQNFIQYFFKDELLKGTFNMRSGLLDLNEFMTSSEPTADPNAKPVPGDTSAMAVIGVPGNIDFMLNSTIKKLIYDKIDISDVSGGIGIKDKKVNLSDLKMHLLGGSMSMSGSYATVDLSKPTADLHLNISDFDIPSTYNAFPMVQKLAPVAKYTKGRFSTDLKFNSVLDKHMQPLINSLNGEGMLMTKAVTVSGFEPLNKLADALKMDKFRKADFSDLKIHYSFKDGKVNTDEFPFKSGSVLGSMLGSTSFDQTIDYKMKMEVPTKDMPDGAKKYVTGLLSQANMLGANAQLPEKVKLNALFGGTVLQPIVKTDVKEIVGNVKDVVIDKVKDVVNQKKDSIVKDVKKDVSKEVEKILKDAEAEAQKVKDAAKTLSEQTKKEGYANAQKLEDGASNPIAKVAAKKAADKVRKETDEKAAKIITDGNTKADDIMKAAHEKADKLKG